MANSISYVSTGGEDILDVDWQFSPASALVVTRTRAGSTTTLVLDTHYTVAGAGDPRGGRVILAAVSPAIAGDVYTITYAGTADTVTGQTDDQSFVIAAIDDADWVSGATFRRGFVIFHNRAAYVPRVDHVATAADEPGVGVAWEAKWRLLIPAPIDGFVTIASLQGFSFVFSSSTDTSGNPGNTFVRLNNADPTLATAMTISATPSSGTTVANWLASLGNSSSTIKGRLRIQKSSGASAFIEADVTSVTLAGTHATLVISGAVVQGTIADTDAVDLAFFPAGEKGGQGASPIGVGFETISFDPDVPVGWVVGGISYAKADHPLLDAFYAAKGYPFGSTSTHFGTPDVRGRFGRFLDAGAGLDADAGSRTDRGDGTTGDNVGTKQGDTIKSHVHAATGLTWSGQVSGAVTTLEVYVASGSGLTNDGSGNLVPIGPAGNTSITPGWSGTVSGVVAGSTAAQSGAGAETRPTNIAFRLLILADPVAAGIAMTAAPGADLYTFDTATSGTPAAGKIALNNAAPASATRLRVADVAHNGDNIRAWLLTRTAGEVRLYRPDLPGASVAVYTVSAASAETGYVEFTLTHIMSSGGYTAGTLVAAFFSGGVPGAKGDPGPSVAVEDDGTEILAVAARINFAGAGVSVADAGGGEATVTIPGGAVAVDDDGTEILASATRINFAGAGVSVADAGSGEATVTIPGGGAGVNQNLLINGDFNLNQRAFAGGALSAGNYGYDRWKAATGGANLSLSGYTLTLTSGEIEQVIETALWGVGSLASTAMTVSVDAPADDLTVTVGSTAGTITAGSGRRSVTVTTGAGDTGNLTVKIKKASGSGSTTFGRVKIEVGSSATDWVARPDELLLSMRYYYRSDLGTGSLVLYGYNIGGSTPQQTFPHPGPMRVSPTRTKLGTWTVSNCDQPTLHVGDRLFWGAYVTVSTTGAYAALSGGAGAGVEFEAEL